ncbi:MAG: NlpC/P60 family protein [Cytophagales bacterium]
MEVQYGVCRLTIVSVRKDPNHLSQQVTQLLFGDHYEVWSQSKDRKWLHIRVYFDQSIGWVDAKHHHPITSEYFEQINTAEYKITTEVCSTILYKKTPVSIVIGSVVPISQSELFKMNEQFAFNGEAKSIGQKRDGEFVKNIAMKYFNAPEQEGGRTPFGVDDIGLIQCVYRIAGYTLPRNLISWLNHYPTIAEPHVGDLVVIQAGDLKSAGLLLADDKVLCVDGRVKMEQRVNYKLQDADSKIATSTIECFLRVLPEQG